MGWGVYIVSVLNPFDTLAVAGGFRPIPMATPSPDGKHIAIFGTVKTDSTFALYVAASDGSMFRKLKDIDENLNAFITDLSYSQWIK